MQYYVTFFDNGSIDGFYNDAIHSVIPETATPITTEQWQTYSADARLYKRAESGDEPCRLKTQDELDAEAAAQPLQPPTMEERLKALEDAQLSQMGL